jgi:outer membrane biosynthesis protein TonB
MLIKLRQQWAGPLGSFDADDVAEVPDLVGAELVKGNYAVPFSAEDKSDLEERRFSVAEVCRMFKVKPERLAKLAESLDVPKPVDPPQPVDPPKPVEAPKPVDPPKPVEAPQPVDPPKPVEAPQPVDPPKPVEAPKPVDSGDK